MLKTNNPELYDKYYRQLRSMMGTAGIGGLLEILADLSQEFGDAPYMPSADSFWLNAAAQIDDCREKVEDLV